MLINGWSTAPSLTSNRTSTTDYVRHRSRAPGLLFSRSHDSALLAFTPTANLSAVPEVFEERGVDPSTIETDNAPLLQGRGGSAKAKRVFGELKTLITQLNEAIAA